MTKSIWLIGLATAAFMAMTGLSLVRAQEGATSTAASNWKAPQIDKLPDDEWGRTVRYGRDLIAETSSLIGPETKDPALRFAGNNLNCQSCHLEAGTKQFGQPLIGVYGDFPNYRAREGMVGTIEDRIQGCMARSMNGRPLPPGSRELTAMVAYIKFLSTGIPVGGRTEGRGAGRMPELSRAADPVRGRAVYAENCAACHGADGQGQRVAAIGDGKGYSMPPLWGNDSFNDGAGMARLITAANFIRSNMPFGTSWTEPALSLDDTWDVAAFVISQPRPHKANLDRDFPNRTEKPVDAAYGPYADGFSPEQHRLGPFDPIRKALKSMPPKGENPSASHR